MTRTTGAVPPPRTAHASPSVWLAAGRPIPLEPRPRLMGIVNLTPDSFSDGGMFRDPQAAVDHALRLVDEGADILDLGGESTRPGADAVTASEELRRVLPVIDELRSRTIVPVSIDTTKLEVAREAIAAGAAIVNDVSALRFAPGIAELAAETGAGLVLMHMRGEPRTMQRDPRYEDLLGEVGAHLRAAAGRAEAAGVDRRSIVVDPGIGFGKTARDSWHLLSVLELLAPGYPVLVGHSRKSFLDPERRHAPRDRLAQSLAAGLLATLNGAAILRVHEVAAHTRMLEAYRAYEEASR